MRLFVAVLPDEAALDVLDQALVPLREAPGAPKWTERPTWHLTLAFLGEVDPERVPALTEALDGVARDVRPFTLKLRKSGTFPPSPAARVLWAGVAGKTTVLKQLAIAVQTASYHVKVRADGRSFSPHLTLGKWRKGEEDAGWAPGEALAGLDGPAFTVDHMVLFHSLAGRQVRYETVRTFPFESE
jgi:2'-5' RNA ligase